MARRVVLELPAELPEESLQDSDVLKKGKETIVLELLRRGKYRRGRRLSF